MEQAKEYIKEKLLKDIQKDEKILKKVQFIFKNEKDFEEYVNFYWRLSEHKQRYMNSINNFIHDLKYKTHRGRILGTESKAMPHNIYTSLIRFVEKRYGVKQKLALEFEGIQGARGEDVVNLKVNDFDFNEHTVRIHNQKRDRWYELPLNNLLEAEIKDFIKKYHNDIEEHKKFLFFSSNPVQKRNNLSQRYLKNIVHESLEELGLNKSYGISSNNRELWLYSLHSLRGHAATKVMNKTGDLRIVQQVLDHQPNSANTTMLYLEREKDKLKDVLN